MSDCGNRVKKKQVEFVPYTTDAGEFCSISPGGAVTPTLSDHVLIEDASNADAKACVTLQQIKDLIQTSGNLPIYDCIEDNEVHSVSAPLDTTIFTFTTIS